MNGEVGWYIGPSLYYYRYVKCFFPRTREERDCNTVQFFLHEITFPRVGLTDYLKQAAIDLILILSHPPVTIVPSLKAGDPTRNALLQIAGLLKRIEDILEPQAPEELENVPLLRVKARPKLIHHTKNTSTLYLIPIEEEDDISIAKDPINYSQI